MSREYRLPGCRTRYRVEAWNTFSGEHSDDVTYEVVNFIDGTRTVAEIRDAVSAEFEPVDLKAIGKYMDVLAKAGAIRFKP